MRIGFASTEWIRQANGGWEGGGTLHYRFRLPAQRLLDAGHECAIGELVRVTGEPRFYVRRMHGPRNRLFPCDVVVLQRYMNAELPAQIKRAREAGQIVINDVDDYFDGLPESNRAYWTTHPDPMTRARGKLRFDMDREPSRQEVRAHIRSCEGCQRADVENREHYRAILASGDAITVSTEFLRQALGKLGPPVHLLRNALDMDVWPKPAGERSPARIATWYGALGFRASGDFAILRDVLPEWLSADPSRVFVHGGSTGAPDFYRMLDRFNLHAVAPQVTTRPGVPIRQVQTLLEGVDVSLVPLEDCEFNHAKSALKGMESAAAGVPFVASALPEYEWFDQGILVRTTQQWLDALESLTDPLVAAGLAERAREHVEQVAIDRTWPGWLRVYEELAESR